MTTLEAPQGRAERVSGPFGGRIDMHNGRRRRPGVAELSGHVLGEIGSTRTEHQVKLHEGFAPGAVALRDPIRLASDGSATKIQARPPGWTATPGVPCIPDRDLDPEVRVKHMDQWDTRSELEAEKLCGGCPVRGRCLASAMLEEKGQNDAYRFMVRGGLTPKGRWRLENRTE